MNSSIKTSAKRATQSICLMYIVYIYCSIAFYGWQVIKFIIVYSNLNESAISDRLIRGIEWQPQIIAALFVFNIVVFSLRKSILLLLKPDQKRFLLHLKIQLAVLGLNLLNTVLVEHSVQIHFLQLLGVSLVVWSILLLGFQFYYALNPAWQHPTTIGAMVISAMLLGVSFIAVTRQFEPEIIIPVEYFIFLILFDVFVLFARFKFLSKASRDTIQIARRLMGSLLLFTGIRIILGIFIPLVYCIFMLISGQHFTRGIGLMIIIGVLLDRFLFIWPSQSAFPQITSE